VAGCIGSCQRNAASSSEWNPGPQRQGASGNDGHIVNRIASVTVDIRYFFTQGLAFIEWNAQACSDIQRRSSAI